MLTAVEGIRQRGRVRQAQSGQEGGELVSLGGGLG